MKKSTLTETYTYFKIRILLFVLLMASTGIAQPFMPKGDEKFQSYPKWPAKGYVITNAGDSISGTITKSSKNMGRFLQSITMNDTKFTAKKIKSFGFVAYLDKEKHFYRTNKPPCGSSDLILSILRFDTRINPKKGNKVFMWKKVDEPGLVIYQNPGSSFTHTIESGTITKVTDSVKLGINKKKLKLELSNFINTEGYDKRNLIYDDCGNIVGYLKKDKSIFRTDVFSHTIVKGMEEDYFYNSYYLVTKDQGLIKLNRKNYMDQWPYLWKGCQAVDDFAKGKKNYGKIKKFMRLVSIYSQQCE